MADINVNSFCRHEVCLSSAKNQSGEDVVNSLLAEDSAAALSQTTKTAHGKKLNAQQDQESFNVKPHVQRDTAYLLLVWISSPCCGFRCTRGHVLIGFFTIRHCGFGRCTAYPWDTGFVHDCFRFFKYLLLPTSILLLVLRHTAPSYLELKPMPLRILLY